MVKGLEAWDPRKKRESHANLHNAISDDFMANFRGGRPKLY